ncbi:zinc-binding alcohol dehydrogenase family protein [Streptomyces sp. NPDC002018]|uniref:quinone oxidoreductase family protein n=1 Tax=Streptomyces sp. NPDC002018 TaxID=3364629 RepID=UPI0036789E7E
MRAIVISQYGGPETLTETELPDPRPGPGQLTIDTTHAAVGLVDVFARRGDLADHPGVPNPPFVPGLEVAGTVRELGPGVTGFEVGDPVVTLSQMSLGGYASVTLADPALVVGLKGSGVDPAQAVAALPNATTAHLSLTRIARLAEGERVLVHGAAGGLAATYPAVARALGASHVTGTVSSRRRVRDTDHLGFDEVITSDRFVPALESRPVDVVIDPVGGELRTASLNVLKPLGRVIVVGHAANTPDGPLSADRLWLDSVGVFGFSVGPFFQLHPEAARPAADTVVPLLANGALKLHLDILPLSEAAEAHRRLEAGHVPGRIVLTV